MRRRLGCWWRSKITVQGGVIYREIARGKPRVRQAPSLYVESKQLHRLVAVD